MRRFPLAVLVCSLAVAATVVSPASAARFRFGTRPVTARATPTSAPSRALGVSDWIKCGVTLTPATTNNASFQLVFPDGAGGAVVAWSDQRGGSNFDCFASRLGPTGNLVSGWSGGGNAVSVIDSSQVITGSGTDNGGGGFFLYTDVDPQFANTHDIYLQHLTSSGAVASGYPAGGKTMIQGSVGTIGMLPDGSGGLYFGWSTPDGSNVRVKRLDATGAATLGWPAGGIDTGVPDAVNGEPALDGAGGFYLALSTATTVVIQRYSSTGVASGWPGGGLTVAAPGAQVSPTIVKLSNNDALVAWVDPATSHVFAQRINAAGTVNGSWPAGGKQVSTGTAGEDQPELVADAVGGALIVWQELAPPLFLLGKPFVQRLTSTGGVSGGWPATGVQLLSADTDYGTSNLISDGANGAIVAWTDLRNGNADIYMQRVLAGGAVDGAWPADGAAVCDAAGDQAFPQLATDGANGAIVALEDVADQNNPQFRAARVLADGTVSALASLVDASAEPGVVRLHWYSPDGSVPSATVERAELGGEFVALGEVLADGAGHLRFEDQDVTAGTTYQYRLAVQDGAATAYLGEVTVRVPASVSFGIEGLRPNPAESEVSVVFALASAAPARLELLDVAGRRVHAQEVGMLGPGQHVLRLEKTASLPAGIYVLRLTQAGRVVVARAAIVR